MVLPQDMSSPRAPPPQPIVTSASALDGTIPTGTQNQFAHDPEKASYPQHCIHADVDDLSPSTLVPCAEHAGCQRRTIFGFKKFVSGFQKAADPYDYENKYQEDEEYQETGPNARVWRTANDVTAIVDANRVTTWTDALDVLLVFAGLFSAVVSSFVSQTYQLLQVDNVQTLTFLTFESINVQRAIAENIPVSTVPRSPFSPETVFYPSSSAVWVNGLWFLSLTLSLTTALIAVLTKQWIHAYTESVQSAGTARDRSRLRQLRSQNFDLWHVAGIIGMLPVLMHVALGIFFAGMIIFLLALSTRISFTSGSIVAIALVAYFVTNILPIFKPSCPYITPLTHFGYTMLRRLDRIAYVAVPAFITSFKGRYPFSEFHASPPPSSECTPPQDSPPPSSECTSPQDLVPQPSSHMKPFPSLRDLEVSRIQSDREGNSLDASTMVGLYTGSSNSSVQSIALEALSHMPLNALPVVFNAFLSQKLVEEIWARLNLPEFQMPARLTSYQRLTRALFRVKPGTLMDRSPLYLKGSSSLCVLFDLKEFDMAGKFICGQVTERNQKKLVTHDLIVWIQILRTALRMGTSWLGKDRTSDVWKDFIYCFVSKPHGCRKCMHAQCAWPMGEVYCTSLVTVPKAGFDYNLTSLFAEVNTDPDFDKPMIWTKAVTDFLIPSLSEVLLETEFRGIIRGRPDDVPADIILRLAMIQSRNIVVTSVPDDMDGASLAGQTIRNIGWSVGLDDDDDMIDKPYIRHPGMLPFTFNTLKVVVIDPSVNSTLARYDMQRLLHALFKTLLHAPTLAPAYRAWMTDSVASTICDIAFGDSFYMTGLLLVDIFTCETRGDWSSLLPLVYKRLCDHEWLAFIERARFGPDISNFPDVERQRSYHFLALMFVTSLSKLHRNAPAIHSQVLTCLRSPSNLLSLCKLFLFADVKTREGLWDLPPLKGIAVDIWDACLVSLGEFLSDDATERLYDQIFESPHQHPHTPENQLRHDAFGDLGALLAKLSMLTRPSQDHLRRIT